MISSMLAHGGGIDELAMFIGFPTVVGAGVWLLTRQKPEDLDETNTERSAHDAEA